MHLHLLRDIFTKEATLGILTIDNKSFGFVCEDQDRGLSTSMSLTEILKIKVKKETAIPSTDNGTPYKVGIRFSPRHNKDVLYLKDVPGFQYIEIHVGNTDDDTEGCQLPGLVRNTSSMTVGKSKLAVDWLEKTLMPRIRSHNDVTYSISRIDGAKLAI